LSIHMFEVQKNPECPLCGNHPMIRDLAQYSQTCVAEQAGTIQCGVV
jgi:hypothetical protein